jgi:serine/threonine-protein kinase
MTFSGPPAISPDGALLVYAADPGTGERNRLFMRRLDQIAITALPETEGGYSPFFSPDGQSVGFSADGKLKTISVNATVAPIVVCDVKLFMSATWMADGTIVFSRVLHGLQRVSAAGGVPYAMTTIDSARPEIDHHAPRALPGGKAVLLTVHEGQNQFRIDVLLVATGARKTLIEAAFDPQYLPTGHLVYASGRGLSVVPFALDRLELTGAPVKLVDGVKTDAHNGIANFALATNGTLVFVPESSPPRRTLVWVDRSGASTPLPTEPRAFATPRLSPDGRRLAVVVTEDEHPHIWVYHLDDHTFGPVTFEGRNRAPLWTRDGLHLTYTSERNGVAHLMSQPTDGSALEESLISSKNDLFADSWSADNRSLLYTEDPPTNNSEVRILTLEGRRTERVPNIPERNGWPVVSPDGRWLAFGAFTDGRPDIYVQPFPGPGMPRRLAEGGGQPVWSHDGRELFFRTRRGGPARGGRQAGDGIFRLPFDPIRGVASAPETQLFRGRFADAGVRSIPGFDVSADGRRFLMVQADE